MKDKIKLKRAESNEDYIKIKNMMVSEPGIYEIFGNKLDRLIASPISFLILKEEEIIGFVNLVDEDVPHVLYIDKGIIKKHRGNHYSEQANEILCQVMPTSYYLIGETKSNNIPANRCASKTGTLIYQKEFGKGYLNFYLMNRSLEELKSDDIYPELIEHCEKGMQRKRKRQQED